MQIIDLACNIRPHLNSDDGLEVMMITVIFRVMLKTVRSCLPITVWKPSGAD